MSRQTLTHVDASGAARMVDVSHKAPSPRRARAIGCLRMQAETHRLIAENGLAKGDVLGVARVAGIMAAKRTSDLIPLCHPLPLTSIRVELTLDASLPGVRVEAEVATTWQTGVEMEALIAATIALLTVYDMAKGVDRTMTMDSVQLVEKVGGTSGTWSAR
jgi:cyclic pyranopterin monophosphate synthase